MHKLALGTVQFGLPYGIANSAGQVSLNEVRAILDASSANGIDTIDTAIAYGDSEAFLGICGVGGFNVVTKLPSIPDGLTDVDSWIHEQVQDSLARLGVHHLYGLLLHRSQQLTGPRGQEVYKALERLKCEGVVQKIGVSIYSPDELDAIVPCRTIDLVQAPFNLIDSRLHSSGWLKRLYDAGIEIHARSAFLQGLLLMPHHEIPARFSPWASLWDSWHEWLGATSCSAIEVCLSYVQSFPEIARVVVGVETVVQLQQLIDAVHSSCHYNFPDIASTDEKLINPSNWALL